MTDEPRSADERSGAAWPPSNSVISFAILSLAAAGVALAASSEVTANRLAAVAYYALAVGVAIRLGELLLEDRIPEELVHPRMAAAAAVKRAYVGLQSTVSQNTEWVVERFERGEDVATSRGRAVVDEDVRTGLKLAIPLTFVGGALMVVWWSSDPTVVVSNEFVGGWLLALGILSGLYVLLSRYARE